MPAVRVSGVGVACALGVGVDQCRPGLAAGAVNAAPIEVRELNEPLRMAYYRIPDGTDLLDPARADALLPVVAMEAVRAAGLSNAEIGRLPIFVGSSAFSVRAMEARYAAALVIDRMTALALPHVSFQHLTLPLQATLGNSGDTYAFNTACTAAANALMMATRMIRAHKYPHALVVGFELANVTTLCGFSGLQLVTDAVRPFDLARSGIVLGEGIGAVVLSAASGSVPGLYLHAGAANVDTYSVTTANPDGRSIAAVQTALLAQAGVTVDAIRGIKAHGTASPLNDTGEAAGIRRVFADPPPVCAMKGFIGHTLGACGVNELVLFATELGAGFLPGTPGFQNEDAALRIVPAASRAIAPAGYYLLDHFGFGGHNTALLMERRD